MKQDSLPRVYGPDERPSLGVSFTAAVQHAGILLATNIAYPLIVLGALGDQAPDADRFVGLCFIIIGVGTLLQSSRTRFFGSGLFVPATTSTAYLPGLVLAAEQGGVSLVAGMMLVGAATQLVAGLLVWRIRHFVTVEMAGVVVLAIGILLALVGFRFMLSINANGTGLTEVAAQPMLGVIIFVAMAFWAVYTRGQAAAFAALFGLVLGAILTPVFGAIGPDELSGIRDLSPFDVPMPLFPTPTFALELVPEFVIAGIAISLRAVGDIITAERASFKDWTRPNYSRVSKGIVADAITSVVAALIGALGVNTFSGSVGIAAAAGLMSRFIAQIIGVILILIGLSPITRMLALAIPTEVSGAVLVFASTFVIVNGILVIGSRTLDNRRILIVGSALVASITFIAFPVFFANLPAPLATLAQSHISAAVIIAILLTLAFSVGTATRTRTTFSPVVLGEAEAFVRASCARGGVAKEVLGRMLASVDDLVAASTDGENPDSSLELAITMTAEKVVLVARSPQLLRLAQASADEDMPQSLDDIDELSNVINTARLRLLKAQATELTASAANDQGQIRLVYDQ